MDCYQSAPYAAHSGASRGRVYPETFKDQRPNFERDRDRVIHCAAFRRLEYKTQVFVYHVGDYYRTRLTHSIEVAQIARGVAKRLGLNMELTETLALAHDLGHTPFGHAGEAILADLMADHGGFEHNVQSLRVVTLLEERYPNFPGLNLTWETREGIVKHATFYDHPDDEALAEYEPEVVPTLEAQLINCADSIAYHNHDTDDGIESGLLDWRDMHKNVALWRLSEEKVQQRYDSMTQKQLRLMSISQMIGLLVEDLVTNTDKHLKEYEIGSLEDVREANKILVNWSPEIERMRLELNDYLYHSLYRHNQIERMFFKVGRILPRLFEAYLEKPRLLPPDYASRVETYGLHRSICDYIAGMTDRYVIREYEQLYGPFRD
ncbi:MAG: deoxyguanosinetriphosphate triphosphohydrolase [Candidatus Lernaella stagnicola]|nr:deoxyguanosinetriphosphate triphosphohydrolase [Candidatus Lernaella stagnicola]